MEGVRDGGVRGGGGEDWRHIVRGGDGKEWRGEGWRCMARSRG